MALRSERLDSKVDPEEGIYVEMEGIMEVRNNSEDIDFKDRPEDFIDFQARVRKISENFCEKNKETTMQAFFYCIVCNCDLKSLRPLRDHVTGQKHIKKALAKKRQILGVHHEPQNAPRMKLLKKKSPCVDIGLTLADRLKQSGIPAVGLEYISEYTNPREPSDHPMYTCRLDGCKSAWGTSDDFFNHCTNTKHQKNFFKVLNPKDNRIAGLGSNDIIQKAEEYEQEHEGSEERDYGVIGEIKDYVKYRNLSQRPHDWSEGRRVEGGWISKRKRGDEEQLVIDESFSKEQVLEQFGIHLRNGVKDVQDMVEEFAGVKGDVKYQEIEHYKNIYSDLLSIFEDIDTEVWEIVACLKSELSVANNYLVEKVEMEDRSMKAMTQLMLQMEEEVKKYDSERDTNQYANIKFRLSHITNENKHWQPISQSNVELESQYNKRLIQLGTELEDRSDTLVEVLEKQFREDRTNCQRKRVMKDAIFQYREEITKFVNIFLKQYTDKFEDEKELCAFTAWVVGSKVLDKEVNMFSMKDASWETFHVTSKTMHQVEMYLKSKMAKYTKGEVYN